MGHANYVTSLRSFFFSVPGIFWRPASRACKKEPPAGFWNPVPSASIPHTADGGIAVGVTATRNTCAGGQPCHQLEEYILDSAITLSTVPEPPPWRCPGLRKGLIPPLRKHVRSCRLDRLSLPGRADSEVSAGPVLRPGSDAPPISHERRASSPESAQ